MTRIRKVIESDNKTLAMIIKNVFEEHNAPREGTVYSDPTTNDLYGLFKKEDSVLWVVEDNNEVVGCCGVYPTEGLPPNCAELVKFYILSKARGKGLGTKLMQKCIASAKEFGYNKLYIESMPQFDKAVSMYKRIGFTNLNHALGNSGHTSCNIWMIMNIGETDSE